MTVAERNAWKASSSSTYLALDPGAGVTTLAIGPEKVADLGHITVKAHPGADVGDAVVMFLAEAAVDPGDVLCAVAVVEPATGHDALGR